MHPPSDDELHDYPHVFLTVDSLWNPDYVDEEFTHDLLSDVAITEDELLLGLHNAHDPHVDAFGGLHLHVLDALQEESTPPDLLFFDAYESIDDLTVSTWIFIFGKKCLWKTPGEENSWLIGVVPPTNRVTS